MKIEEVERKRHGNEEEVKVNTWSTENKAKRPVNKGSTGQSSKLTINGCQE
jgi:hypothetical protein